MSDDLDFDMEVVETDETVFSSSNGQQKGERQKNKAPVSDWEEVKLYEVVHRRSENVDPSETDLDRHVGLEHISSGDPSPDFGSIEGQSSTKRHFLPGDVLFGKLRPYLEKVAQPDFEGLCTSELFSVVAEEAINGKFLLYRLSSKRAVDYAVRTSIGTRMPRTSWGLFENFEFELPPLPEQRKIASVLCAVDQAIQKTEAIIEQAKRVKRGLMQKFFREGFGGHSNFVDSHHRNCLHRHPTAWETLPAGEVMGVSRGSHPRPKSDPSLWGGEIPIIKIGDRDRGDQRRVTATTDTVTEKGSESSKRVPEGTLIVSNAGTCGVARITGMEACIHDHWLILSDYEDRLDTRYLFYYINYNQDFLATLASGSTVDDLNTDDFRLFDIAIPLLEEQRKIAAILDGLHDNILQSESTVDRLKRLKKGLMQDLLTGEVRTTGKAIDMLDEVVEHG